MHNIDAGDINRRLATLSDQERSVLRLRCEATDYKTIGETLHIAVPTVKQYMSRIYVKLGLDLLSRTERTKALFETFCPVFQVSTATWLEGEVVEEPIPLLADEIVEEPISPLVEEMVNEDENAIVLVRPQPKAPDPDPVPPGKVERKPSGFRTLVIGVVLGICLGGASVLWVLRSNLMTIFLPPEATSTSPVVVLDITSTATMPPTESASQTPVIIVVTATSLPFTETPTLTPLPQPVTLFEDNFNQGLSGSWSVASGNPIVVNGQLTSEENSWLRIGDDSWSDYTIELDVEPDDCWFGETSSLIGVRAQDMENMIAFNFADCENEWNVAKNGNWTTIPNSYVSDGAYEDMHITITVRGGEFIVNINGERVSSFFSSDYTNGGVAIRVGAKTLIDNLKITFSEVRD